jgi:hypothetical protein
VKSSRQVARPFKKIYILYTYFYIFSYFKNIFKKFNPLGSPGTAVFIMRINAFSAEMEVCVIFYISITIEAKDSNKKTNFVPHDMDYNSYYYEFLLNSFL